jgi:cytochrome P450
LQKNVDEGQSAPDFIHSLPYIDAIINETLRLKPVVPSGQTRVTPPEGLFIDETWIPGNTILVVPQYVVQRDARNFPRPLEFIPERWLEKESGLIVDDRAFFPFAIGKKFSSRSFS